MQNRQETEEINEEIMLEDDVEIKYQELEKKHFELLKTCLQLADDRQRDNKKLLQTLAEYTKLQYSYIELSENYQESQRAVATYERYFEKKSKENKQELEEVWRKNFLYLGTILVGLLGAFGGGVVDAIIGVTIHFTSGFATWHPVAMVALFTGIPTITTLGGAIGGALGGLKIFEKCKGRILKTEAELNQENVEAQEQAVENDLSLDVNPSVVPESQEIRVDESTYGSSTTKILQNSPKALKPQQAKEKSEDKDVVMEIITPPQLSQQLPEEKKSYSPKSRL